MAACAALIRQENQAVYCGWEMLAAHSDAWALMPHWFGPMSTPPCPHCSSLCLICSTVLPPPPTAFVPCTLACPR